MKLLLDQNLPRRIQPNVRRAGHDGTHPEDEGLATALDPDILRWCRENERLLVSDRQEADEVLGGVTSILPQLARHS